MLHSPWPLQGIILFKGLSGEHDPASAAGKDSSTASRKPMHVAGQDLDFSSPRVVMVLAFACDVQFVKFL